MLVILFSALWFSVFVTIGFILGHFITKFW